MIYNLIGNNETQSSAEFVIIGGGTAGLTAAALLAEKTNCKVICLESGGDFGLTDQSIFKQVKFLKSKYGGASEGRLRGLGGTSAIWGGAFIPFQNADLAHEKWPLTMDELRPFEKELHSIFKLDKKIKFSPEQNVLSCGTFVTRNAKWPPFKLRNTLNVFSKKLLKIQNLKVYKNAHVTKISKIESGFQIICKSDNLDNMQVTAKKIIIAAGALETTRLVLNLNQDHANFISNNFSKLGYFFGDHISTTFAEVSVKNWKIFSQLFGWHFGSSFSMWNRRFELGTQESIRSKHSQCFVHISPDHYNYGAFKVLRSIAQTLQTAKLPLPSVLLDLFKSTPDLAKIILYFLRFKVLPLPKDAKIYANLVLEQETVESNFLKLNNKELDQLGSPKLDISWSVSKEDILKAKDLIQLFDISWNKSKISKIATLNILGSQEISASLKKSEGTFHPYGTTRMSHCAQSGVVDKDLRIHGMPNVQLLSTSVFPTGGGANPTMMLLLLALRCVDQHRQSVDSTL